jgi:hypothetical protein
MILNKSILIISNIVYIALFISFYGSEENNIKRQNNVTNVGITVIMLYLQYIINHLGL